MRTRLLLVLFVLWGLSVACVSTAGAPNDLQGRKSIPSDVNFTELETNPDYIGSYSVQRERQRKEWKEWGEWTQIEYSLTGKGPEVCFGGYKKDGIFRADQSHQWVIIDRKGESCLRLEKK